MTDEDLIKKTLKLAERGRGKVSPNPLVGAVITKNDEIIAEGFHREFGGVHAEVAAFDSARQDVSGGTLFLLEIVEDHLKTGLRHIHQAETFRFQNLLGFL